MPHFSRVGEDVGANDGEAKGMALGDALGDEVGWGDTVGRAVGTFVGLTETLGEELGAEEGELEILGAVDGTLVSTGGFVGSTGAVLPLPKTGERPSSNGGFLNANARRFRRVNPRVYNRWYFRARFTWVHRD
jgi:hypothetical protein